MKITNDSIGPWAKISSGSLYTLLSKLEKTGLIAPARAGKKAPRQGEGTHAFTITEKGRTRFRQLMRDTSSNLGDYQKIFRHKVEFIDLIQARERLFLFNHYVNYCRSSILHVQTEMDNLASELGQYPNPAYLRNVLSVMKQKERQCRLELDWVRSLLKRERARVKG